MLRLFLKAILPSRVARPRSWGSLAYFSGTWGRYWGGEWRDGVSNYHQYMSTCTQMHNHVKCTDKQAHVYTYTNLQQTCTHTLTHSLNHSLVCRLRERNLHSQEGTHT